MAKAIMGSNTSWLNNPTDMFLGWSMMFFISCTEMESPIPSVMNARVMGRNISVNILEVIMGNGLPE
jgi:hypothetical protein